MAPFSEETWSITYPNYDLFKESLTNVIDMLNDGTPISQINISSPASLEIEYQFTQSQTQKVQTRIGGF